MIFPFHKGFCQVLLRIDTTLAEPLYGQIASQLTHAIARGEIEPGSRLPSAKELASAVNVNLHTVLHAYAVLRDAGLVELRPRRGAVVLPSGPMAARLMEQVRQLVEAARGQGFSQPELIDLVRNEW